MSNRTRRERIPFSANRKRLDIRWKKPEDAERYYARWFNDQDGRPERALEAGYEYVKPSEIAGLGDSELHQGNTDLNSRVSKVVGRAEGNIPIRAYLMRIDIDWYNEDQAEKEKQNAKVDEAILAGKAGGAEIGNPYGKVRFLDD